MKIEEQVVSQELAKEMETLGFKQESIWVWMRAPRTNTIVVALRATAELLEDQGWVVLYAAYTDAELMNMLPEYITSKRVPRSGFFIQNEGPAWHITLESTEANARAKMCIWQRKEGYM